MRAWEISAFGATPLVSDLPRPVPAKGEALVRVAAAGLNFADLLMIAGTYQSRPRLPFVPGMECAGTVEMLGPDTPGPVPGTRVLAIPGSGALAEWLCLPVGHLSRLPDAMPFEEAAGFPIAYATSHLALGWKAALRPGETLFVTGAAGGVGLTAVEIGKRLGARVIASARGATRLAAARAAGADLLIDSEDPDLQGAGLKDRLRAEGGVDVVLDLVGGPAFDAAMRACNPDGRLLAVGFAAGEVPRIPANQLLVRNLTVIGFWLGAYQSLQPARLQDSLATLLDWRARGLLHPHAAQVLPFESFPEGLELLRSRRSTGKVVIRVQSP
jgi:NADPH:quinone reductase